MLRGGDSRRRLIPLTFGFLNACLKVHPLKFISLRAASLSTAFCHDL